MCLPLLALLPACATIVEGTSDTITVSTTPAGATCTIDRNGERVGAISATPGSVRLSKSHNPLDVTCSKEGFQTATVQATSSFTGTTFGNILLGGVIGVAVDAASGANSRYPGDVRLTMAENPPPVAVAPVPPMAMEPVDTAPEVRPVSYTRRHSQPGV